MAAGGGGEVSDTVAQLKDVPPAAVLSVLSAASRRPCCEPCCATSLLRTLSVLGAKPRNPRTCPGVGGHQHLAGHPRDLGRHLHSTAQRSRVQHMRAPLALQLCSMLHQTLSAPWLPSNLTAPSPLRTHDCHAHSDAEGMARPHLCPLPYPPTALRAALPYCSVCTQNGCTACLTRVRPPSPLPPTRFKICTSSLPLPSPPRHPKHAHNHTCTPAHKIPPPSPAR